MTEQLVIEGVGLKVTKTRKGKPSRVDEDDIGIDPKRRRPPPIPDARHDGRATTGRTWDQVVSEHNPYWTEQENEDVERA